MNHNTILFAEHLSKSFKAGGLVQPVLDNFSLSVFEGEFLTIIGKSGTGKSTLLHIIAGIESADSGEVAVKNIQLSKLNPEQLASFRLRNIGVIFQFFHLLPNLSLLENILVPGYLAKANRAVLLKDATELMEWVGINDMAHKLPHQVSGGELQRAAIARSLINKPALLLADEPTGNLDEENGDLAMELFSDSRKKFGTTIIMVTHDAELAKRSDRTLELFRAGEHS